MKNRILFSFYSMLLIGLAFNLGAIRKPLAKPYEEQKIERKELKGEIKLYKAPTVADIKAYNNIVFKKLGIFETKNSRFNDLEGLAAIIIRHALSRGMNMFTKYGLFFPLTNPMERRIEPILKKIKDKIFKAERYAVYPFEEKAFGDPFIYLDFESRKRLFANELQELNKYYELVVKAIKQLDKTTRFPDSLSFEALQK
ncbi:hypothetical protein E3J79_02805 [Candidatus Dependentiae bacterium]|nr:MAG: hypothetical protein E3J79_02805 [Candidatus Dependentiae bacterium]